MVYAHESNINTKIRTDYKGLQAELTEFKENVYLPFRTAMMNLHFVDDYSLFVIAARLIEEYRLQVKQFANTYGVTSQSKFESSFFEEINVYLFREFDKIQDGTYDIYNAGIYKDLKITENLGLIVAKKNVDICIGKQVTLSLGDRSEDLIVPTVCVEVKTYLDSTMLGEATTSSKMIRLANPDAHTYILAGYKSLVDTHLLVSEKEAAFDDIFFLQADENSPIDPRALYAWWKEIYEVINNLRTDRIYNVPGRMFKYVEQFLAFMNSHPLEEEED